MTTTAFPALNDAARAAPFGTGSGPGGIYTRADVFRDNDSGAWGDWAHRKYYGEIVKSFNFANPRLLQDVLKIATRKHCEADPFLNNTPLSLQQWDSRAHWLNTRALREAFKDRGDFVSQSALLCILKEAVRQCHGFDLPVQPEGGPNQARPRGRQRQPIE